MYLMMTLDANGKRQYTLQKSVNGVPTVSAHPAGFSPDDPYSRQRFLLKTRYSLLPTQLNMEQHVLGAKKD